MNSPSSSFSPSRIYAVSKAAARHPRRGSALRLVLVTIATVAMVGLLWGSMSLRQAEESSPQPLVIFCAASNQAVLEAIRGDYERAYGIPLQIQYGPSQTLMAGLEVSGTGDLYLPADDSYLTLAAQRNLTAEVLPLARMRGVVAVAKGNPKKIEKLDDLFRPDVRFAQGATESTAIGKLTRTILEAAGQWDAVHAHTMVYKTTVNEVANDVKVGAVDA
jgi:molybdate transport system substrate-binding protein